MRIGHVELILVSDGTFRMDAGAIFGVVPKVVWSRHWTADEFNRLTLSLRCLLLRSAGQTILIDTGYGDKLTTKQRDLFGVAGESGLLADLARHGVAPEDVDVVINTHLHRDHCGGNTRQAKAPRPTFPRAEYWAQRAEWVDAERPNERTRAAYLPENLAPLAQSGQLRLLDGDAAVTPEVRTLLTPGHTRGHQCVMVQSASQTAVFTGDLTQTMVQLERLAWVSALDDEPLVALETKRQFTTRAVAENWLLISAHDARMGYLRAGPQGLALEPLPPEPA